MEWPKSEKPGGAVEMLVSGPFRMEFQPIVNTLNWSIFGYEALFRGTAETTVPDAEGFFRGWKCTDEFMSLDAGCVGSALRQGAEIARGKNLFINIHTATLKEFLAHWGVFMGLLARLDINPENVVFEISERTDYKCALELSRDLQNLHESGVKLAIDDVGNNFNWLHNMLCLKPKFLKVDKAFITDMPGYSSKKGMVKGLSLMSRHLGLELIAEGIECPTALSTLKECGVGLGQGFLIARPQPAAKWLHQSVNGL